MDISRFPLKLGLTVDFGNYGSDSEGRGEYVKWFADDTSGDGPKMLHVYVIDRHVHSSPNRFHLGDIRRLEDVLGKFALFLKGFPQVELITFQFPYNQLPPELNVVSNMDELYGSADENLQRKRLLEDGKIVDIEEADYMIESFLEIVSRTDFSSLKFDPIVLFHAGGILPTRLVGIHGNSFNEDFITFGNLRRRLLDDQLDYHRGLLNQFSGKKVTIGLENAPIWDVGFNNSDDAKEQSLKSYQWLSEHAFEDFEDRLSLGGTHTIDIPHTAMDSAYFSQKSLRFFSMEMLRRSFGEIPPSLSSVRNYVKRTSEFFKKRGRPTSEITFHLADCNGLFGDNEGVIIGSKGSVINWRDFIGAVSEHTPGSYGAIEVQNGHVRDNYRTHIVESLANLLGYSG